MKYLASARNVGIIVFNDTFNTYLLRLYGIGRVVKTHLYMEYSFRLESRDFYMHHPTDTITHTTAPVIGGIAPNQVIARSEFEVHRQMFTE